MSPNGNSPANLGGEFPFGCFATFGLAGLKFSAHPADNWRLRGNLLEYIGAILGWQ